NFSLFQEMSVKVVLTPWVTHDGGAIYSLDASPNEYKLATSGNGDSGEGCIVIWSLLPMLSEKHGRTVENHNPLLARIPMTGSVNAVRWSRCGNYFAAASDDKTVTVWEYGGRIKSAGTIGMRKEETNLEKYKCIHTLHGHAMEVLAVEWSWNRRFLASSSMDNTIIVWNALKLPERLVVLDASRDGHTGAVKGLSFDPIGKYLASQSQDKTLKVWNMENWTCETTISQPFEESAQSTMFMRPEWSPDGKMLVAPCAMNNGGPTAQLVQRGNWDTSRDLVGHRKAVTVVRSASRCFEYEDSKGRVSKISLFAVGSRDKSLSVWALPVNSRPLVVINNFFKHSIMDASWKGTNLVCCSQDGTVRTLIFDETSVGRMLRQQEMSDMCYELYRTRLVQHEAAAASENGRTEGAENGANGCATKGAFVETAADLIASRTIAVPKRAQKDSSEREREEAEARAKAEAELAEQRKEQIENRTKEGKRRIQPVFLCSTIDNSAPEKPEIPDDVIDADKLDASFPGRRATTVFKDNEPPKSIESMEETESSSDDGASSSAESSDDDDVQEIEEIGPSTKRMKLGGRDRMLLADFRQPVLRPLERLEKDSLTLAAAELQPRLQHPINGVKQGLIVVQNEWASSSGVRATKVVRYRCNEEGLQSLSVDDVESSDAIVWTAYIPAPVLLMTAHAKWTVVACSDCSLHVLSTATGAVSFMLQLDSLPAQLGQQDARTYVLTSNGYFSSWDLNEKRALVTRAPVLDIVSNDVHLHSISLAPSGAPLISFSNGSTYSYSINLQSWIPFDVSNGLSRLAGESFAQEDLEGGAIAKAIKSKKRPAVTPSASLATRAWVSQSQMEGWIFAALDAKSYEDLCPMVARYIDMLIMDKATGKIREMLSLIDSWVERARRRDNNDEWMDEDKMKQLKEMVSGSMDGDEEEGNNIF
ncbi:hira-1, partial [Pristionchus pacificus]